MQHILHAYILHIFGLWTVGRYHTKNMAKVLFSFNKYLTHFQAKSKSSLLNLKRGK